MNSRLFLVRGFTLLEMLVVIVLLSLMTTLISYGISLGGKIFERAKTVPVQYTKLFDSERWLRQTVANTLSYSQESLRFVGTSSDISGITTTPLKRLNQAPTRYTWQLVKSDEGVLLNYREGVVGEYETIRVFGDVETYFFEFTDMRGRKYEIWPTDDPRQLLPTLITLVVNNGEQNIALDIFPLGLKYRNNIDLESDA